MLKRYFALIMMALTLFAQPAFAEDDAEEEVAEPKPAYFTLEPDLTTNFHTVGKKLGYIKVRIDIMVSNDVDLPIIDKNQPLIRDIIVELLGRQSSDTIKSLLVEKISVKH